ncbi:MAG: radical SAM family heme chaperone HemW, partial [Microcystaceae cyanobacterium]
LLTVFFGGGTPSLLPIVELEKILNQLDQQFGIDGQAEISLEIDPATFTLEKLQDYRRLGVNRVSLGAQAFQDHLLKNCGRFHQVQDIYQAVTWIEKIGFKNWSLDLISGLPEQGLEDWTDSLETAIALFPTHLSCYDLVLEPVTAFGKRLETGKSPLPTDENAAQMYRLASQFLRDANYEHYEISNYAKSGYQCQHNRVYWENRSYYGFGLGAASYVQGVRFTRPKTRQSYYDWVKSYQRSPGILLESPITARESLLETLMLGLRLTEGIKIADLPPLGLQELPKILKIIEPYLSQNWVQIIENDLPVKSNFNVSDQAQIRLTDPEGLLFSNTILTDLFEGLEF